MNSAKRPRKGKQPTGATVDVATVRVELRDSDPLIWREVEVPTEITLADLHSVIQAVMNWDNDHLWEFTIEKRRYGPMSAVDWGPNPLIDAEDIQLREVLRPRKTHIDYLYDFGDSWEHGLTVTRIRAREPDMSYPRYLAGERGAPPEDCGGLFGFYSLLEALVDRKDPDHGWAKERLKGFAPDLIDEKKIARRLGGIGRGIAAPTRR
ncbi:pRiA4b ORF-3-like protein [Rhizobiales bacterium GAS113]|jgi:hypothetical protein|nr:pRiA4b ORF-3-like protein [Rhizobiales bacterium GAS113]